MIYPKAVLSFIVGPVRTEQAKNGQTILTHLQKYSPLGFMITWPFCLHIWFFWHKQELYPVDSANTFEWKPGTERGIYCRTPGYRWDADLGMKWTWGFAGGHWD